MLSALRMDGGSDHARPEISVEPVAANTVPFPGPIGGGAFTYPNLGNIGSSGLNHAGLNPATNLG